jgi:signal transduction histidine kinase
MQQLNFFRNKLKMARLLMVTAILLITAFQSYWVIRLYREEREGIKKEANNIFRDVVYNLQAERFRKDSMVFRSTGGPNIFVHNVLNAFRKGVQEIKQDSALKITSDSVNSFSFVVGKNKDTSSKRNRMILRGGAVPMNMEGLITYRQSDGKPPDSAMLRQLSAQMGMGVSIMVRGDKNSDSIMQEARRRMPVAGKVTVTPAEPVWHPLPEEKEGKRMMKSNMRLDFTYPEKNIVRLLTTGKVLDDSIPVSRLDSVYRKELSKVNIPLAFSIHMGKDDSLHRKDTLAAGSYATRPASVGFIKPYWYQAAFEDPAALLVKRVSPQILFSLFLVAFTSVTFLFLYRNLAEQRRLTEMKNDFISNITHELKTPIATVSVAVEALRNFGGMQNPERTKEYLDISAAELQRLGLLVDKVLKLSLFENRALELKKENFDLKDLLQEVVNTMRLQFEKHHAVLNMEVQGSYFMVHADRLHITSVIYNLLDNALKYSTGKPEISVLLKHDTDNVQLSVSDKGMGIPQAFRNRIFDKFFRVPTGDHHNIKGYGLGLSYVAGVVEKHGGTIEVVSEEGKGSTFTVKLPIA